MAQQILYLRLDDLSRNKFVVMAKIKVFFSLEAIKAKSNPQEAEWQCVEADGDYRRTNRFINSFLGSRLKGEYLSSIFSDRGVGLLQFMPSYTWPCFYVATQTSELVSKLVRDYRPNAIVLYASRGTYSRIFRGVVDSVAANYSLPFEVRSLKKSDYFLSVQDLLRTELKKWGLAYIKRHLQRLALKHLSFKSQLIDSKASRAQTGKTIMFITLGQRYWRGGDHKLGYDENCYPVARALADFDVQKIILVDAQAVIPDKLQARRQIMNGVPLEWVSFSNYISFQFGYFLKNWRRYSMLWKEVSRDADFNASMFHENVSLVPALMDTLGQIFMDAAFESHEFLEAAKRLISAEGPDAVLLLYETGPIQRSIIIEADRAGIPTIGLQHGMIFDNHYDYMHADVSANPIRYPRAIAIPKLTCVWGDYWRDVLVRHGNYPKAAVQITGNWRYDELTREFATRSPSSNNNDTSIKTVAILTAGAEIYTFLTVCLGVLDDFSHFRAVVKIHPSDSREIARAAIEAAGLSEDVLFEGDLRDLLLNCDVVVSQYSTAVAEALLMNKPVILFNINNLSFTSAYRDSGACLYAISGEELRTKLISIMNDSWVLERLLRSRIEFTAQYFYNLDGKSALRVAEATLKELEVKNGSANTMFAI